MAYLEPGVYSKTISNRPLTGAGGPSLVPLVIGSGATVMKATEVIIRGEGTTDVIPTSAKEILSIGYTAKKADFTKTTDYTFSEAKPNTIDWSPVDGRQPAKGESYTVTYTYEVSEDQYLPRFISGVDALTTMYGEDIKEDGTVNNLVLAAKIVLEAGTSEICVIQVDTQDTEVTSAHYQTALDKHAQFIEDIWRIVPADLDDSINGVIDGHVKKCSSYEERKERCAVYAKSDVDGLNTAEEIITTIGGAAKSKDNERTTMVYPTEAIRVMSNGSAMKVSGQFIAAAFVGMEGSMPLYKSKTRATSSAFQSLGGVKLTRSEKNKLAENGVMIFEQPAGAGTNVVCRHQISTNMDSPEFRENSVLACKDYAAKYFRGILDGYIGKYNVTADTITKITGSINSGISTLVSEGYILEGSLRGLAQDELNPDTLILDVVIKVPYPCNYIRLTIISE